jgi:hypothetical protein
MPAMQYSRLGYQAPTAIMTMMVKVETHAIAAGMLYHSGMFIVTSRAVAQPYLSRPGRQQL